MANKIKTIEDVDNLNKQVEEKPVEETTETKTEIEIENEKLKQEIDLLKEENNKLLKANNGLFQRLTKQDSEIEKESELDKLLKSYK